MALDDLTGKIIKDTYQRVVQTDGTNLTDGTGSALPIKFEGSDLIVSGALRANSYIVSESILNVSSGSTVFGNSHDDTHTFSGSVDIKDRTNTNYNAINTSLYVRQDAENRSSIANGFGGSIDFHTQRGSSTHGGRSGRIASRLTYGAQTSVDYYALDFSIRADDTQIDILTLDSRNTNTAGRVGILDTTPEYTLDVNGSFRATGDINANGDIKGDGSTDINLINNIIATSVSSSTVTSGNITATLVSSSTVTSEILNGSGSVVTGFKTTGFISASGDLEVRHITTSQNISASGGSHTLGGDTTLGRDLFVGNDISASGNLIINEISTSGNITSSGNLRITGSTTTAINLDTSGHITASGNISSSGKIHALDYFDNNVNINTIYSPIAGGGSIVTVGALDAGSITSNFGSINVGADAITTTGTLTGGPLVATGNTSLGTGATHTHTVIGNITSSGNLRITGSTTTAINLDTSGHISASGNISSSGNIYATQFFAKGANGFKLNQAKYLWLDNLDLQVGNDAADTDIIGTSINLNSPVTASSNLRISGSTTTAINLDTSGHITASGNISASGDVTSVSASFSALKISSPSGSMVGQRHILWSSPVYINTNPDPLTVDAGYFGSSAGNTRGNWNDETADAFDSSAGTFVNQVNITEDKQNKMFTAPFAISRIEVLASWRPGGSSAASGEGFWVGLWTGSAGVRLGAAAGAHSTNAYIGWVTGSKSTYDTGGDWEGGINDLDYTFSSPLAAHTQIFYGMGTTEASSVGQKNVKGHIQIIVYEA